MTKDNTIYLGFDPGGHSAFGVTMLEGGRVLSATVSSVEEAMSWTVSACDGREPAAAGIDTLLHWSDGASGWRPADKWLRMVYPAAQSSILSPNSLFGSMVIGGMALALRLRLRWPDIRLNETHPKVLAFAFRGQRHRDADIAAVVEWFALHSQLDLGGYRSGHEFDAVLSAWATRTGLADGWVDLVSDDTSLLFPAGKASYLWPQFPAQG
jgi:predicted nuclease with RNAse H fold